jgi:hypothetical protein
MTRRLIENPEQGGITIRAGRTSPPSCLVTWHASEIVMPCSQVRELAGDMFTAAARATAEAATVAVFRTSVGAPDQVIAGFIADLRRRYVPRWLGVKDLLTFVPGVSLFDGRPFVHANVKPYEPLRLEPDVLRAMASDWLVAAESAERDAVLAYALTDATDLTTEQIARVFAAMRNVRPGGLRDEHTP